MHIEGPKPKNIHDAPLATEIEADLSQVCQLQTAVADEALEDKLARLVIGAAGRRPDEVDLGSRLASSLHSKLVESGLDESKIEALLAGAAVSVLADLADPTQVHDVQTYSVAARFVSEALQRTTPLYLKEASPEDLESTEIAVSAIASIIEDLRTQAFTPQHPERVEAQLENELVRLSATMDIVDAAVRIIPQDHLLQLSPNSKDELLLAANRMISDGVDALLQEVLFEEGRGEVNDNLRVYIDRIFDLAEKVCPHQAAMTAIGYFDANSKAVSGSALAFEGSELQDNLHIWPRLGRSLVCIARGISDERLPAVYGKLDYSKAIQAVTDDCWWNIPESIHAAAYLNPKAAAQAITRFIEHCKSEDAYSSNSFQFKAIAASLGVPGVVGEVLERAYGQKQEQEYVRFICGVVGLWNAEVSDEASHPLTEIWQALVQSDRSVEVSPNNIKQNREQAYARRIRRQYFASPEQGRGKLVHLLELASFNPSEELFPDVGKLGRYFVYYASQVPTHDRSVWMRAAFQETAAIVGGEILPLHESLNPKIASSHFKFAASIIEQGDDCEFHGLSKEEARNQVIGVLKSTLSRVNKILAVKKPKEGSDKAFSEAVKLTAKIFERGEGLELISHLDPETLNQVRYLVLRVLIDASLDPEVSFAAIDSALTIGEIFSLSMHDKSRFAAYQICTHATGLAVKLRPASKFKQAASLKQMYSLRKDKARRALLAVSRTINKSLSFESLPDKPLDVDLWIKKKEFWKSLAEDDKDLEYPEIVCVMARLDPGMASDYLLEDLKLLDEHLSQGVVKALEAIWPELLKSHDFCEAFMYQLITYGKEEGLEWLEQFSAQILELRTAKANHEVLSMGLGLIKERLLSEDLSEGEED